jgi:hypothetical protein
MSVYTSLLMLALCVTVTGCTRTAEAESNSTPMVVASAGQSALQTLVSPDQPKRVISSVLTEPVSTPEDSPEYFRRMAQWNKAYGARNADAYPYPPRFDAMFLDRYPFFDRLDCSVAKDLIRISCTFEAQPQELDELSIVAWVPYLSNRDVLNPLLRCTSICINQDSVLVGAVQPAMVEWMRTHCKITPVGRDCN